MSIDKIEFLKMGLAEKLDFISTSALNKDKKEYPFEYLPTISLYKFTDAIISNDSIESKEIVIENIIDVGNVSEDKANEIFNKMLSEGLIQKAQVP